MHSIFATLISPLKQEYSKAFTDHRAFVEDTLAQAFKDSVMLMLHWPDIYPSDLLMIGKEYWDIIKHLCKVVLLLNVGTK